MIGIYNYTVILTYIGTLSGFIGITYVWNGNLQTSLIFLLISGFCDMFDGKIASTMERTQREKRFGIQIDSLSDLICFGVLPSLIVYSCAEGTLIRFCTCATYLLCALIRLAWFNVDEEERQTQEEGNREIYIGLPVTTSALIIPLVMGIGRLLSWPMSKITTWILLIIAVAFLMPFHIKKPALLGKIGMLLCGLAGLTILLMGVNL